MAGHPAWLHGVFITLAALSQAIAGFFSAAASAPVIEGLFQTTTANVSDAFLIEASLAGWADSTWIMLNTWSAAWLLYSFSTVMRRNAFGAVCSSPEVHPPVLYLNWIFINIMRIGWLFLWDNKYIATGFSVKTMIPLVTFSMLMLSYRNLHHHRVWLSIYSAKDVWCIRYLTQNSLAMFAWWTLLEALVNCGVTLRYVSGLQDPIVSAAVLTVLLFALLIWFILESFTFEPYMRYTFTVYPTVILGLGAIFTRSYQFDNISANTVYCGVLMIAATVMSIMRLVAVCFIKEQKLPLCIPNPHLCTDSGETVCQVKDHENKFGINNMNFSPDTL